MYAPTQGPVNTGFAQTEIEAKASGSDILKGQLVRVLHNADDVPTVRLTNNADRSSSVPLGVAKHDFKQGYNGTVVIAGVGMVYVAVGSDLATATRSEADIEIVCSDAGVAVERDASNTKGTIPFGMTIAPKGVGPEYVAVAFSGYARVNSTSNSAVSGISASGSFARTAENTLIPEPGVSNRILLPEKCWNPKLSTPAYVDVYRESFYQAADGTNATGDITLKSSGVHFIVNVFGFAEEATTNRYISTPADNAKEAFGFKTDTSAHSLILHRGNDIDEADDGYFAVVDYVEFIS